MNTQVFCTFRGGMSYKHGLLCALAQTLQTSNSYTFFCGILQTYFPLQTCDS